MKHQIKSPAQKIAENQIDISKANYEANTDTLVQILNGLGGLSQLAGGSIMSKGITQNPDSKLLGMNPGDLQSLLGIGSGLAMFANGGKVKNMKNSIVEVEGDEVAETPTGQVIKFKGPKHENGGIVTDLPPGTEIFSERISVDDETLAKRKLKREKQEKKFKGNDSVAKNSLKRTQMYNEIENDQDMELQELVKLFGEDTVSKFATGGIVDPQVTDLLSRLKGYLNEENTTPSSEGGFSLSSLIPNITAGDALGIGGNLFQAFSSLNNTEANRAGDTPNINPFEGFGQDALQTNREGIALAGQIRDKQLQDLELNRSSLSTRNRQGARSINTMRGLDLAGSIAANQGEADINANYASQLMSLLQSESQLENQRDHMVMSGEAQRDFADRQDRDAYYTNRGANLNDLGRAISLTGANLNDIKSRDVQGNILNDLFDYVGIDPMTGAITQKQGANITGRSASEQLSSFESSEGYKNLINPETNSPFTKAAWDKLPATKKQQLYFNNRTRS